MWIASLKLVCQMDGWTNRNYFKIGLKNIIIHKFNNNEFIIIINFAIHPIPYNFQKFISEIERPKYCLQRPVVQLTSHLFWINEWHLLESKREEMLQKPCEILEKIFRKSYSKQNHFNVLYLRNHYKLRGLWWLKL